MIDEPTKDVTQVTAKRKRGGAFKDISGQRFGKLLVLNRIISPTKGTFFLCLCDCGKRRSFQGSQIRAFHALSCGCANIQSTAKITHGLSRHRVYQIWFAMRRRCNNASAVNYHLYGGRGISVCERWNKSFHAFVEDMGLPGRGESIDRIDCNGMYEVNNCRWATRAQQASNKRNNVWLSCEGETHTVCEWADLLGIKRATLFSRLKHGWNIEEALLADVL